MTNVDGAGPLDHWSGDIVVPHPVDHLDDVLELYSHAWWCRDRSRERVAAMLSNGASPAVGVVDPDGTLVAFARAITDFCFKAVVVDVLVDPARRGVGFGQQVVRGLVGDARLSMVDDVELYCDADLVGYYEALGFISPERTHFMRRPMPGRADP